MLPITVRSGALSDQRRKRTADALREVAGLAMCEGLASVEGDQGTATVSVTFDASWEDVGDGIKVGLPAQDFAIVFVAKKELCCGK